MKELVVISGKGGTGKTSVVAAFASLASREVLADCDVDAADLHLILQPEIRSRHEFRSGHEACIDQKACSRCGSCLSRCRFDAIRWANADGSIVYSVDPVACEGCGVCVDVCPAKAIRFPERVAGEWFISDTRHGPLVHARLGIAAENSGKLVSIVRQQARQLAEEQNRELVLVDGPPGIGCPVIASITGSSLVLIITEPTLSGQHDLQRVVELARHFRIPGVICVNKWDLNPAMSDTIEAAASDMGLEPAGRIRYDRAVTAAQVAGKTVLEYSSDGVAQDIKHLWANVESRLDFDKTDWKAVTSGRKGMGSESCTTM
jgi:MinD superfamily P-loop ATPase